MTKSYFGKNCIYAFSLILLLLTFISCQNKTDYERVVERELSKDVRYDSLFLGYEFGMHSKEFFKHSWELNQQQIVTGGAQVEYELKELSSPARMVFYPDFHNERIYRMPIEISYKAWAPWNRELYSDTLITELIDYYEDIYGSGFFKTSHPDPNVNTEAWIKIDGNRRITIYKKDEMTARVEFLDLSVKRENSAHQ